MMNSEERMLTIDGSNNLNQSAGVYLNKQENSRVQSNNSGVSLKKNLVTVLKSDRDENQLISRSNSQMKRKQNNNLDNKKFN